MRRLLDQAAVTVVGAFLAVAVVVFVIKSVPRNPGPMVAILAVVALAAGWLCTRRDDW